MRTIPLLSFGYWAEDNFSTKRYFNFVPQCLFGTVTIRNR